MFDDAEHRAASAPKQQEEDSGSEENGSSGSGREDGSSSSDDGGGSDDDEAVPAAFVEHIFDSGGIRARRASAAGSGANSARGGGPAGGAGGLPATPQQQLGSAADELRMRIERKRFMSSKAAVITKSRSTFSPSQQKAPQRRRQPGGGTPGAPGAAGGEGDGSVSREEFRSMQREVQLYGERGVGGAEWCVFFGEEVGRWSRLGFGIELTPSCWAPAEVVVCTSAACCTSGLLPGCTRAAQLRCSAAMHTCIGRRRASRAGEQRL